MFFKHLFNSTSFALVSGLCLLLLTNCTPDSPSGSTASVTFTTLYTNTIQGNNCARCHQPGGSASVAGASVDFTSQATAYKTLVGTKVSAQDVAGTCGTVNIVTAFSAATSYLAAVTIDTYYSNPFVSKTCAPASHTQKNGTGSVTLSTADTNNLTSWINAGALNN